MAEKFSLRVNGTAHNIEADPDMPLLYALRNDVGLKNPRFGCGLAQCGACTVHIDGQAIRSCITPVSSVGSAKVLTPILPFMDQFLPCRCRHDSIPGRRKQESRPNGRLVRLAYRLLRRMGPVRPGPSSPCGR